MAYKYIFILSKIATEMMEARFLRTVGNTKNKSNRMFIANRMAFLFIKSSYLSDEIYDAMRCRGFSGEILNLNRLRIQKIDFLWILNNIIILIVLFMGELLH
jgi:energy-coupling factor transporter transmembrane protein EcfT